MLREASDVERLAEMLECPGARGGEPRGAGRRGGLPGPRPGSVSLPTRRPRRDPGDRPLHELGLPGGPVRPPLVDATPEQRAQLRADLADGGIPL